MGLAGPAAAAPTGPGNAEQAIEELRSQGYRVQVNRLNDVPLDEARVVSVSPNASTRPNAVRSNDKNNNTFSPTVTVSVR
ncbi:PASTA domain-containing protein [Mycolicibacterium sp. KC 300]|uniref:PASTA domain-containing protein n=1 Tax=Mycolicibacterium arseniciresistens TaxID=3062257 RepID=A0ABT8ULY6_9MYCO|nr:PASTA domain-containing protein [Mycolicibacterium arseniciresistens]